MTSGKDDEEFFRQRGFGIKIGFGERPALIVIDMINGFTDATMPLGAPLETQLAAQKPLIEVAHERNIPVIFSTVIYNDHDLKDAGLWAIKMKGTLTLKAGTTAVEVDERLDMRQTDSLLVKKYASCFFGTDLASRLMNLRADTLIITGCTTSGCVRATAVDAVQNGFRPIVVREAVGDRSAAAHEQSLFDLNAKYADVVGLDETLQYMKTVGHNRSSTSVPEAHVASLKGDRRCASPVRSRKRDLRMRDDSCPGIARIFSAIMMVGMLVLARGTVGMIEASTTRKPVEAAHAAGACPPPRRGRSRRPSGRCRRRGTCRRRSGGCARRARRRPRPAPADRPCGRRACRTPARPAPAPDRSARRWPGPCTALAVFCG